MMLRFPEFVPLRAGVFALVNERKKYAYISFTQNLQKRSHSMSHMLLQYDQWLAKPKKAQPYWPIRDMPKRPSDEFCFFAHPYSGPDPLAEVHALQAKYERKGYKIVAGHRAASGVVRLNGKLMKLADAVADHSDVAYLTVYRRLQRGWTVRQALGLDPPSPRWHTGKQHERKVREARRASERAAA